MKGIRFTWDLFVQPGGALLCLRERPSYLFPLLVATLSTLGLWVLYFNIVDATWLLDHFATTQGGSSSAGSQQSGAATRMTFNVLMWSSLIAVLIGIPLSRVLEGAYYQLASKIIDLGLTYKHWLSLACWTSMPLVLGVVGSTAVLLLTPNGQISQAQVNILSFDELFLQVGVESRWHSLLTTLTLLHVWCWALAAFGIRLWTGRAWLFSSLMALLPWLVIYGSWTLFLLI